MSGNAKFRFLNEERQLRFPEDWQAPGASRLWLYNLHYFEDLCAIGSSARRAWHTQLMQRWIAENPPRRGVGWESYPLSLRIVNWIKWAMDGNPPGDELCASLATQVRYLRRRLEYHLLGNHLFSNAKALVFAGAFFSGPEAAGWFDQGMRLIDKLLGEQVLADGAHFELSPMYHALALEDLLDLINIGSACGMAVPANWRDTAPRMFDWLRAMCHPDGGIAFFNDAALGLAPTLCELKRYAADLGVPVVARGRASLPAASGYVRMEAGAAVLIADCAAIGPDYLPAHGHADSLSFELSLQSRRVLVNSGTSIYAGGPLRQAQRGTAAHNTLRLDGRDSSDVWAEFRVARRARTQLELGPDPLQGLLQASHDGYRHLSGAARHRRRWQLGLDELNIFDSVEGKGYHRVECFLHFHPDWSVRMQAADCYIVRSADAALVFELSVDPKLGWYLEEDAWYPEFGRKVTNVRLRGDYQGRLPLQFETRLTWRG
ncbi:MAG: alginate lyase family protein [Rhodocyclaceae bacterium]|nr:alginate lyase family protein [Rhodocyclaceae bacterium]MBX3667273.1 alginate lyase family protein [Rhodocyclaceae bacterium]